jgi:hypothetical protein
MPSATLDRPIPRVTLRIPEAAIALGMSDDHFNRYVRPHLRLVKSGNLTLVPVAELAKWSEREAQMELGGAA